MVAATDGCADLVVGGLLAGPVGNVDVQQRSPSQSESLRLALRALRGRYCRGTYLGSAGERPTMRELLMDRSGSGTGRETSQYLVDVLREFPRVPVQP